MTITSTSCNTVWMIPMTIWSNVNACDSRWLFTTYSMPILWLSIFMPDTRLYWYSSEVFCSSMARCNRNQSSTRHLFYFDILKVVVFCLLWNTVLWLTDMAEREKCSSQQFWLYNLLQWSREEKYTNVSNIYIVCIMSVYNEEMASIYFNEEYNLWLMALMLWLSPNTMKIWLKA